MSTTKRKAPVAQGAWQWIARVFAIGAGAGIVNQVFDREPEGSWWVVLALLVLALGCGVLAVWDD